MNWQTLLSLGDSITIGSRSYLSYPEQTASMLSEKLHTSWNVINHATCGFTTIDLARSMDPHIQNYQSLQPGIVTIMIGTNDTKGPTKLEDYKIAYEQVIIKAKLISVEGNIVLISIPPIFKNALYPYIPNCPQISEYNLIIEKLALKYNCRVMTPDFKEFDFFDGVHLNNDGAKRVGIKLASLILKDKGYANSPNL